ncbi:MAG TPA: hypothetical protein VFN25_16220 [Dokdonella sp.]|uniref:hypothetical protein n=1 Tax=Dokdonella sp. TaxID=2291710 RepID=UPI002D804F69|nr:hypothetical protein [Dokdonella sp.]HET9034437.1 hypothetical protein [Dokdonella sp.]
MNTSAKSGAKAIDGNDQVTSKIADQISDGIDQVASSASRFSERLRNNGSALHDELNAAGERFGDGAKRLGTVASEQIRAHPLAAVGIAVAAGVLLTRMMRRR